jgi:hypothetical protein
MRAGKHVCDYIANGISGALKTLIPVVAEHGHPDQ